MTRAQQIIEELTAYHGTPHPVAGDRFSVRYVGKGEGAQVYGWGLYFAEEPEVAKNYKAAGLNGILVDGKPLANHPTMKSLTRRRGEEWREAVGAALDILGMAADHGIAKIKPDAMRWAARARRGYMEDEGHLAAWEVLRDAKEITRPQGNLYQVDLLLTEDELLDWESTVQRPAVERKLRAVQDKLGIPHGSTYGKHVYDQITEKTGSPKNASRALLAGGIKGIVYFDQASRMKQEGKTRNFVVFDGKFVKTREANGQRLLPL